jgi:CheY-like chemotaxis protein
MGPVILVVDDETDSADLLEMILKMRLPEAIVQVAYGGRSGLEVAKQRRPDAAVLDLEMPELDGEKLAMALRTAAGSQPWRVRPPHEQARRRQWPRSLAERGGEVLSHGQSAIHRAG